MSESFSRGLSSLLYNTFSWCNVSSCGLSQNRIIQNTAERNILHEKNGIYESNGEINFYTACILPPRDLQRATEEKNQNPKNQNKLSTYCIPLPTLNKHRVDVQSKRHLRFTFPMSAVCRAGSGHLNSIVEHECVYIQTTLSSRHHTVKISSTI